MERDKKFTTNSKQLKRYINLKQADIEIDEYIDNQVFNQQILDIINRSKQHSPQEKHDLTCKVIG